MSFLYELFCLAVKNIQYKQPADDNRKSILTADHTRDSACAHKSGNAQTSAGNTT
jgi:hypothetical protein